MDNNNQDHPPAGSFELAITGADASEGAAKASNAAEQVKVSRTRLEHLSKLIDSMFDDEDKEEWKKAMRGNLSMAASIIATMSFQLATNPPGGVVQLGVNDSEKYNATIPCNDRNRTSLCPGRAVLGIVLPRFYILFLAFNTLSFIASLSVCVILVSGLRIKHTFPMWLLGFSMFVTIISLALSYLFSVLMVTPDNIWDDANNIWAIFLFVWVSLLGLIGFAMFIRFLVWFANQHIYTQTDTSVKRFLNRYFPCLLKGENKKLYN